MRYLTAIVVVLIQGALLMALLNTGQFEFGAGKPFGLPDLSWVQAVGALVAVRMLSAAAADSAARARAVLFAETFNPGDDG